MPLNPKASVSHNISEMVHAGHPQNQAVAAALNVARNAKAMGGAEDGQNNNDDTSYINGKYNQFYAKNKNSLTPHNDYQEFVKLNTNPIKNHINSIKEQISSFNGLSEKQKQKKFIEEMDRSKNEITQTWGHLKTRTPRATGGGLYANIHAKQERIAHGSHEHMRRPGAKGAPTAEAFRASERTAKADGGFLPVGNPERNDNFKNWFGKSKIVTKNGNPLIVYHSSPEDFDKFKYTTDKTTGVKTNGFYFTPDKNYSYISGQGEGRKVYPVHVKMENPYFTDRPHVIEGLNSASDAPAFIQKLKDMGHDGVIYSNPKDIEKSATGFAIDSPQIFAFHPHQIKSAIGNNGQFDPTNSDITKKVGGYIAKADGGGFSNNQQLGHVPELAPVPKAPTMGNKVVVHEGPIHSPVAGRTDHLPMHVKSGSYVIPADIIGAMGEGNTMAGFKVARRMFSSNPYFQKSMSPYGSSSPIYNSDEKPYGARAAGGGTPGIGHNGAPQDDEDDDLVPIVAAGGEYVISPQDVTRLGEDDIDDGHKTLDSFVTKYRKKTIKVLQNLPGPHRD